MQKFIKPITIVITLFLFAITWTTGTTLAMGPAAGTTLSATKTASGYWEHHEVYDWTLTKAADQSSLTIARGASGLVNYTLNAGRTLAQSYDVYGARGEICVTNGGALATENLHIVDTVQYKVGGGQYQDYVSNVLDLSAKPVLQPSESYCYAYDVSFAPVAGALYRNVAHVTITNHSGWLPGTHNCPGTTPCPFGPDPKADFSIPEKSVVTVTDAEADLSDVLTCPTGFTCTASVAGPWHLSDSTTVRYALTITNVSATCGTSANVLNTATLVESTTLQSHTASATVTVNTEPCSGGCTRTIGYWKTHSSALTPLLPLSLGTVGGAKTVSVTNASQAVTILNMRLGTPSNGITKLYAQLLAAKLNIASGASGSAVSAVMASSDAFLATHNQDDWTRLTASERQQVLAWMTALDDYNNGRTGPGHCSCGR